MATRVFAVEIILQDHASPIVANATAGLFATTSSMAADASSGQPDVTVDDGSVFRIGEKVTVKDDLASETAVLKSVSGNVLTMFANLANSYTDVAQNGVVNGNSVFHWIQNTVSGVTRYAAGILSDKGIGKFNRTIDLKRGGNIASPGSCRIVISNFIANTTKFFKELADKLIVLNGKQCNIFEFVGTVQKIKWSGQCEKPRWNTKKYTIPVKGNFNKRKVNLGTIVTAEGRSNSETNIQGTAIPLTFGKIVKAKLIRTNRKTTELFNTAADMGLTAGGSPNDLKLFQVISGSNASYELRIFKNGNDNSGNLAAIVTALTGRFIKVIEGTNAVGVFRKIIDVTAYTDANDSITITLQSHFETDLTTTGDTWVKIIDIQRDYENDIWEQRSFLDKNGDEISDPLELFSFDESNIEFTRIPQYSFSVTVGANNNKIDGEAEFFEADPDTLNAFIIEPVSNLQLTPDLTDLSEWPGGATVLKVQDGFYKTFPTGGGISNIVTGTLADIKDRDGTSVFTTTFKTTSTSGATSITLQMSIDFNLPDYPPLFTADKIFFMVLMDWAEVINSGSGARATQLSAKRVFGNVIQFFLKANWGSGTLLLENFPDFFFTTNQPSTANKSFYKDENSSLLRTGFKIAEIISDGDRDKYDNFSRNRAIINIARAYTLTVADIDETININAIGVLFQKNLDIKDAIYSGMSGRIFDDTWDGRKTAANLIESPVDVLEHISRIQNWSENNPSPADGWGLGYPTNPKIRLSSSIVGIASSAQKDVTVTSGEGIRFLPGDIIFIRDDLTAEQNRIDTIAGDVLTMLNNLTNTYTAGNNGAVNGNGSFDDNTDGNFTNVKGFKSARQILRYNDAYSDKLKREICRNFFLASWVDKNGRECTKSIVKLAQTISPIDTITLGDIVNRNRIKILEPSPADVFPEPFVRFNKNYATGEFDSAIRVTNVDAENPTDDDKNGFVEGLTGGEAVEYWDRSNALWLKTRQFNKPSTDLTDLEWANTFVGSDREAVAKDYLTKWIDWMLLPRIVFQTHKNIVDDWEEAHRFFISLPFETTNVSVECLLEKISIDPNPPYHVQVNALFFGGDGSFPVEFFIQEVMAIQTGSDNNWLENMALQGGNDDKNETM